MENNNQSQNSNIGEASFNQAGYSQLRLHNLFMRIDELNANSSCWNLKFKSYNYNIIFNDLVSIYLIISSKLNITEKKNISKKRKVITNLLAKNPPHKQIADCNRKKGIGFSLIALEILNKLLLDFRISLEDLMEKYKIGNPNKESDGGYD